MAPKHCVNLWVLLEYRNGSMTNPLSQCPSKVQDSMHKTILGPKFYMCPCKVQMSQCPCKVQDSIHKTIWGPKFYTCPSGAQNFTQGLGCQLIFEISKFFYTEFVLNVFSVPRWVFLASGIKMTLKVPGTILARFENSDPLCGPTMENARIFNTHHGSKRPIMDPPNHPSMEFQRSQRGISRRAV